MQPQRGVWGAEPPSGGLLFAGNDPSKLESFQPQYPGTVWSSPTSPRDGARHDKLGKTGRWDSGRGAWGRTRGLLPLLPQAQKTLSLLAPFDQNLRQGPRTPDFPSLQVCPILVGLGLRLRPTNMGANICDRNTYIYIELSGD